MSTDAFLYPHAQYVRVRTLAAYKYGDWRNRPIEESNEPLVLVPSEHCYPYYYQELGLAPSSEIHLRERVLSQFLHARKVLRDSGIDLKVYDGWRSIGLQEGLFWYYMKRFTVDRYGLSQQFEMARTPEQIMAIFGTLSPDMQTILREQNRTYVSWPSADAERPSPHVTGGSVDVWPYVDGQPANLGVPFDWMEDEAGCFYHLKNQRKRLMPNDQKICRLRNQLIYAMVSAGFSCYGPEIWHFNSGNQMDSLVTGEPARYGYIEP